MGEQTTGRDCTGSEDGEAQGESSEGGERPCSPRCGSVQESSPSRSEKNNPSNNEKTNTRNDSASKSNTRNGSAKKSSVRTDSTEKSRPRNQNGGKSSPTRSVKSSALRSRRSSGSSSSSSINTPPPPDGGWGWAVVFASFIVHLIADGCAFSFGVFYVEFLDVFQESKGKTAMIGALFMSFPLITGPIASGLTNRYGCRKTCMIGGFLAGCGFVASSYANSIEMLCFTFGILSGFGLSMVYVPAIVVVAFYFEKKRAFATGLAVAGTGIGTFVFAPLTELLIHEYTWRGATLIIGGLMFNIIIAGAVFRPLTSPKLERQRQKYLDNENKFTRMNSKHGSVDKETGGKFVTEKDKALNPEELDRLMCEPLTQSLMHFPTFMKQELEPLYPNSLEAISEAGKDGKTLHDVLTEHGLLDKFYHYNSLNDVGSGVVPHVLLTESVGIAIPNDNLATPDLVQHSISIGNADLLASDGFLRTHLKPKRKISKNNRSDYDQLWPMYRKDIFYRGSLMRTRPLTGKAVSCPNIAMIYEQESNSSDLFQRGHVCNCLKLSREVKNIFRRMLHISIFHSSVFMYFCLSTFFLYLAYDVPYVFLPDKAMEMGVSIGKASFLVSAIGIVSTFGQVLLGWVGDFPNVNAIHLYNVITSIAGVVTFVVPFLQNYLQMVIYAAAYGFFISANYALTTIILVQLLGMDRLTNAYGVVMLAEGIANLIGPPAAGYLSDWTGDYDLTFFISGALIFISGIMLIIIPCLAKYDDVSRYARDETAHESDDDDDLKPLPNDVTTNGHVTHVDAVVPVINVQSASTKARVA